MNIYHIEGFGRHSWCYAVIAAHTEEEALEFYDKSHDGEFSSHTAKRILLPPLITPTAHILSSYKGYE